jgi:hypothetical protein
MSARNVKRDYLLRGLIICRCGRKMIGMFTSGLRYRCSCESTFRRGMDYERRDCREKTVNGERLEAATWQYVIDILTDPVRFESEWRKAQQAEIITYAPKRERLEVVETLINEASEEAGRIVREMSEYKETDRERQSYKALRQQRDQNDDHYAKLSAERDRLLAELEAASRFTDEALSRAMQFRADIVGGLKHPTFEDKRQYLELLQVQVKVAGGKAVIRCAFPADAIEVNLTSGLTSVLFEVSSALES